jgi:hypothetical protein
VQDTNQGKLLESLAAKYASMAGLGPSSGGIAPSLTVPLVPVTDASRIDDYGFNGVSAAPSGNAAPPPTAAGPNPSLDPLTNILAPIAQLGFAYADTTYLQGLGSVIVGLTTNPSAMVPIAAAVPAGPENVQQTKWDPKVVRRLLTTLAPELNTAWLELNIEGGAHDWHLTGTNWVYSLAGQSLPRINPKYKPIKADTQPFFGVHSTGLLQNLTVTVPDNWTSSQVAFFILEQVLADSNIVNGSKNWQMGDDDRNLKIINDRVSGFRVATKKIADALNTGVETGVSLLPGGMFVVTANDAFQGKYVSAALGAFVAIPWEKVGSAIAARIVFKDGSTLFMGQYLFKAIKDLGPQREKELMEALNTAKSSQEASQILKDFTGDVGVELMHLLPQEEKLAKKFADAGLDINQYLMYIDTALHRLKRGPGLHTNLGSIEGNWNAVWRRFFDKYPEANKEQILAKLEQMIKDFNIVDKYFKLNP